MLARVWQVLVADLESSRKIPPAQRARVDRALRGAIAHTLRAYAPHFRLAPQVLKGDELQAVLKPAAPALSILTYLRAQLAVATAGEAMLRAGLGRGTVLRLSPKGPFASDGEAFHRAREGLDAAKAGGARLTAWRTGVPAFDAVASPILALTDAFTIRWTVPQWEAIAGRLEGKGLHGIARSRHVSFQSVSKRLRAASWGEVQQAIDWLERNVPDAPTGAAPRRSALQPQRVESRRSHARG